MPESGANSHLVSNNGKAVQPIKPHQSPWLTHWTGTRFESNTRDHLTQLSRREANDLKDLDFEKNLSEVKMASDNFEFSEGINDVDLTISLKKPNSRSFPFFKRGQESGKYSLLNERMHALEPQVSQEKLTSDFNLETSSKEWQFQPTAQVKYHMFFGESSHTTHGPKNKRTEMPSFLRQNNTAFLKTDPSTSSQRSPIGEQYKRMQKHIGMGFFSNQTGSLQNTKSQTLHHGECSFQNVPNFVHDLEMTRMPGGIHRFSRTTHSLLITQQTDVKVYQESQFCRESRVSTQLKGKGLRELNCSPPHFGQSQQGLKLQLLDSSDEDVKAAEDIQKNESSADTDAMDMESFKQYNLSGVRLFPPNKDIMVESNTEKDTRRKRKIELPDINLEISAQPATSSSAEKAEPCTSRTQSLDMNTVNALHFNVDQTSKSNSNECSNSNPGSEPGNRWIKRLKLAEPSSHGKLNKYFTRGMQGKSELELDKDHGKKLESLTGKFHLEKSEFQIGKSSSVETKRECKEISLSHSWIKRWSHKHNQKNPESVETCQLDNSKFETEEFQKKQFPSIAAMALMGKAMTGFKQCKLQKKESFVVWNTKAFD